MSTDIQDCSLILKAIDYIRKRKNRPNLERIVRYLYRVHNLNKDTSIRLLGRLLETGEVAEVLYKGESSFRNTNLRRYSRYKHYGRNFVMEAASTVNGALTELVVLKGDYLDSEISEDSLDKKITENGMKETPFEDLLEREIEEMGVLPLDGGNVHYFIRPRSDSQRRESEPVGETEGFIKCETLELEEAKILEEEKKVEPLLIKIKKEVIEVGPKEEGSPKAAEKVESPKPKKEKPAESPKNENNEEESIGVRKCERLLRKQRSKYDPAEYIFPSLKRKKKEPSSFQEPPRKKKATKPAKKKTVKTVYYKLSPSKLKKGVPLAKQSGRLTQAEPQPDTSPCSLCTFRGNKEPNNMGTCRSCLNKGHWSCIRRDGNPGNWFCPDCKTPENSICVICDKRNLVKDELITCDLCGESFHSGCHKPPIKLPMTPAKKWRCFRCPSVGVTTFADITSILGPFEEAKDKDRSKEDVEKTVERDTTTPEVEPPEAVKPSVSPSPTVRTETALIPFVRLERAEAPFRPKEVLKEETKKEEPKEEVQKKEVKEKKEEEEEVEKDPYAAYPVDPTIPDATSWSSSDVYQYFLKHFNVEIAHAFHEQDIDGQSLLLMQRADVIKGLGFKLGVALKVLYHVKKLQIRRSNLKLLWSS